MRFVVTPQNLRFKAVKGLICTDDYSDTEIVNKRHIRDIKNDFKTEEDKRVWGSPYAYIYPIGKSGIDVNKYQVISIA